MTPGPAPDGAWRRDLALIVLPALAVFAFCLFDQSIFADGDTNWHVATGRWILAHGAVPATDPFSYTAVGRPWVTHEWLSEVLMALVWSTLGWSGIMVLTGACAAAAVALMAAELERWLGTLSVIASLGLTFGLLEGHLLARPHIITLPLLTLWVVQLLESRRRDRTPPLWLLPLIVLWSNLHGSFIFGLIFSCFFALEAFLGAGARRWIVGAKWGAFIIAATAMAMITPNGFRGLVYPIYVNSMKYLQMIGEWQAVNFAKPSALGLAAVLTIFVCLYRGVRAPAVRLILILLLFYMSLEHVRQEIVLAVVAPLLLAEPLGRAFERGWTLPLASAWPPLRRIAAPLAVASAAFLILGGWRLATPELRRDRETVPVTALEHVPPALRAQPVFNNYAFGGWLIFNGVRPFIDGRSDMYGDDLLKLYLDAENGYPPAVDKVLRRYGVTWTILTPSAHLVARLDATPGWRRLYADKWAVVQARSAPPISAPPSPAPPEAQPRSKVGLKAGA